jgi:hypothetical protein
VKPTPFTVQFAARQDNWNGSLAHKSACESAVQRMIEMGIARREFVDTPEGQIGRLVFFFC